MEVSLVSDLHIDVSGDVPVFPGGEVLLVVGDLCEVGWLRKEKVRMGLREQFAKYDTVFAVLGNHEHWGSDLDSTAEEYRRLLPEVQLLENQSVKLTENTILFGATLWTDLNKQDPMVEVRSSSWGDYQRIRVGGRSLSFKDTYSAHKETLASLYSCAIDNPDKDILVMTHFVPSRMSCNPRYAMSVENAFFFSSLEDVMLDNPNIKFWAHGHTHDVYDYSIGNCRVMCNPRGYVTKYGGELTGFDRTFTFKVR